eukprot:g16421.t1
MDRAMLLSPGSTATPPPAPGATNDSTVANTVLTTSTTPAAAGDFEVPPHKQNAWFTLNVDSTTFSLGLVQSAGEITSVKANSFAARHGVRVGDFIDLVDFVGPFAERFRREDRAEALKKRPLELRLRRPASKPRYLEALMGAPNQDLVAAQQTTGPGGGAAAGLQSRSGFHMRGRKVLSVSKYADEDVVHDVKPATKSFSWAWGQGIREGMELVEIDGVGYHETNDEEKLQRLRRRPLRLVFADWGNGNAAAFADDEDDEEQAPVVAGGLNDSWFTCCCAVGNDRRDRTEVVITQS